MTEKSNDIREGIVSEWDILNTEDHRTKPLTVGETVCRTHCHQEFFSIGVRACPFAGVSVRNGKDISSPISRVTFIRQSVVIPDNILLEIYKMPSFDGISEMLKGERMLSYLRETKQKAVVFSSTNTEYLKKGDWADVFRFGRWLAE